jgi:hypothetical protein
MEFPLASTSFRPQASHGEGFDVAQGLLLEETAVFSIELAGAFIANFEGGGGCVETFVEHAFTRHVACSLLTQHCRYCFRIEAVEGFPIRVIQLSCRFGSGMMSRHGSLSDSSASQKLSSNDVAKSWLVLPCCPQYPRASTYAIS